MNNYISLFTLAGCFSLVFIGLHVFNYLPQIKSFLVSLLQDTFITKLNEQRGIMVASDSLGLLSFGFVLRPQMIAKYNREIVYIIEEVSDYADTMKIKRKNSDEVIISRAFLKPCSLIELLWYKVKN